MSEKSISLRDYALAASVILLWGANFSFIKMGLNKIDPFILTLLRFFLSAVPFVFFVKRPQISIYVLAAYGFIFGFGLWGVVNIAIYAGLAPGLSSLIIQFSAFFTIILSYFLFGERINPLQYAGCGLAFVGLVTIIANSGGQGTLLGVALALVGAVSWSLCNILVKKYKPADILAFVIWSSLFSTIPLLVIAIAMKGPDFLAAFNDVLDGTVVISLISQSYLTTVFGYWAWNSLVRKYSAAAVAPLSLMVPVCAIVIGVLAFGEDLPFWKLAATILIVAGVSLFTLSGRLLARIEAIRA
jgi:O-acetylserine/cysteine efflux transporter